MKNNNKLFRSMLHSTALVYVLGVLAFTALMMEGYTFAAPVLLAISALMLLHLFYERRGRVIKIERYLGRLSGEEAEQGDRISFNIPEPMAGVRVDGSLAWYNKAFGDSFLTRGPGSGISEIFPELSVEGMIADKGVHPVSATKGQMNYRIHPTLTKTTDPDKAAVILYIEDISEAGLLRSAARAARPVVMSITVDNYDETIADAGENEQLELTASIDRVLISWVNNAGGLVRKLEKDRYVCVFSNADFETILADKFSVLKDIKNINVLTAATPTLSIGVGAGGKTLAECDNFARAALDMALGRGGDQAAVCDAGKFSYYGGTTKEVEKRTRVKARVMAQSLKEHMLSAENVVIMGHRSADIDAVGSAIGLACAAAHLDRDVKILFNSEDAAVRAVVDLITKNHYHDGLFVSRESVKDYITSRTLLIICDTHRPDLTEMPELLDMASRKVLLDHHRRSESYIEGCNLVYHEPGASSTCEMVTEILMYMDGGLSLSTVDATALYAGIVLDTKNFVFKTGSRTFEAAAYLRNAGVDTIKVKQFFRESPEVHRIKRDIMDQAEIDKRGICISQAFMEVPPAVIAQAADEMLDIDCVKASFVISKDGDGARISGRSLGEINVQLICERLGGGGHAMLAAAQLKNISVRDAAKRLSDAIGEYFDE